MTIDALSSATRAYLDTNIFIYLLEGEKGLQDAAERVFIAARNAGVHLASSEIALAECLYGAHRRNDRELTQKYRSIFQPDERFGLLPVDLVALEMAASIGPHCGLKLIDAIHVATALNAGCDLFVTNDRRIRDRPELKVAHLNAL